MVTSKEPPSPHLFKSYVEVEASSLTALKVLQTHFYKGQALICGIQRTYLVSDNFRKDAVFKSFLWLSLLDCNHCLEGGKSNVSTDYVIKEAGFLVLAPLLWLLGCMFLSPWECCYFCCTSVTKKLWEPPCGKHFVVAQVNHKTVWFVDFSCLIQIEF